MKGLVLIPVLAIHQYSKLIFNNTTYYMQNK